MGFALGNLTIDDFIKRTGYNITEEDKAILDKYRQENATISPYSEALHIFDVPFSITISEPIYDTIIKILFKYEDEQSSKEPLKVIKVSETEKEKARRLEKEQFERERQERKDNPNAIWLVKYHMLIPVIGNKKVEVYYGCFVNVYIKGYNNIPDILEGTLTIRKDENGFTGNFNLSMDNEFILPDEYNWVIGTGFTKITGEWLGSIEEVYFEDTVYSLKDGIMNYRDYHNSGKEIYFHKL